MSSSSRFQKLVEEAKRNITEVSASDAAEEIKNGALVIDVRDVEDWREGHIPGAVHMSRSTIELDIEEQVPSMDAAIICHCGGGSRSALVAENLQRMGYTNVKSMAGGLRAWKKAGLPLE